MFRCGSGIGSNQPEALSIEYPMAGSISQEQKQGQGEDDASTKESKKIAAATKRKERPGGKAKNLKRKWWHLTAQPCPLEARQCCLLILLWPQEEKGGLVCESPYSNLI